MTLSTGFRRLIGLTAVVLLVGGCSSTTLEEQVDQLPPPETATEPPNGLDAEGVAAWQKWRGLELDSYRYRLNVGCFCSTFHGTVDVLDDVVTSLGGRPYDNSGKRAGVAGFDTVDPTIDGLFVELGRAMKGADQVDVTYDPDTGVPTQINVDWISNATDDEIGYTVTDFRAAGSS